MYHVYYVLLRILTIHRDGLPGLAMSDDIFRDTLLTFQL